MDPLEHAAAQFLSTLEGDSVLQIEPGDSRAVLGGQFRRRWVQAESPPEISGVQTVRGRFPDVRPPQLHEVVLWLDPRDDAWPALLAQGLHLVITGAESAQAAGHTPDEIVGEFLAVFRVGPRPARLGRPTRTRGSCCG